MLRRLLQGITLLFPWRLKRAVLVRFFGYELAADARIGLAWVFPAHLRMESGARIDHFTVAIHLDEISLGENAKIGRGNWITGMSTKNDSRHFRHQEDRRAALIVEREAAITKNHHLDCTNLISIGAFTTIAGYHTQLLTHSINVLEGRQDSAPIEIGSYCFVGTNSVVLGGSSLPDYSVLGAKSLLNKPFRDSHTLYGGVAAKPLRELPRNAKYFTRQTGYVV
ncbi:MAG: acyltransferase [Bacteroidota bacterium]